MSPFQQRIDQLTSAAVTQLNGSFSVARLGQVLQQFLVQAMQAAAQLLANQGHEKKQLVLDALGKALDAIPLPWWLALIRPPLKNLVLTIADGAIEAIYSQFKEQLAHE
ncbi:hypothetical protein DTL42_18400 [Bremerella cremea]|uniref:Uncharacterized protein n=2 Tax=Bremerella cremea TaxID=1031537 RepID=A0A368KMS4_9BACT|nr:hypothetical protein DTL42_18400 [Bremerella cremea]